MSTNKVVIFDQNSTINQSGLISVVPGQCVQLNAWNLGVGDTVCVDMIRVSDGQIGAGGDSCIGSPPIQGQQSLDASAFAPCNVVLCMDETRNMIVLRTPGTYRLTLTPTALGTAVVEGTIYTDEDACAAVASECCCLPETPWLGSSVSPCLTITPGGPAGHSPIFNLNPCCVLQSITNTSTPSLGDEVIVLSGGNCFRATVVSLFSNVVLCDSLQQLSPAAFDPTANLVQVGLGGCSLVSNATLFCDIAQALPSCSCEPAPGDLVPIIQGGACVLATWPTVDLCDQIGLLAPGVLLNTDFVPVREAGGNCKVVPATGLVLFPLLAPDGSCTAPSYSFTSAPASGMFYTGTAVRISDDNCTDFIDIGSSITAQTTNSDITAIAGGVGNLSLYGGANVILAAQTGGVGISAFSGFVTVESGSGPGSAQVRLVGGSVELRSGGVVDRLTILSDGAWSLGGSVGAAGEVITSQGTGLPPVWATAAPAFPLHAPDGTCAAPSYSFASDADSGMSLIGGQIRLGTDNCADFIEIGASTGILLESGSSQITLSTPSGGEIIATSGGGVQITAVGAETHNVASLFFQAQTGPIFIQAIGAAQDVTIESQNGDTFIASSLNEVHLSTGGGPRLTVEALGNVNVNVSLTVANDNGYRASGQTSGAGASVGTLTNAPSAGNPAFWLRVVINGVNHFIPAWT